MQASSNQARSRPRVAQIVTRMDVGGVPDHVMSLVRGLQADHDVTVICGRIEPAYARALEAVGVSTISIGFRRLLHPVADVGTLASLVRILRDGRFDVAHTHMSKAALLGTIAARIARVPAILNTAHNLGFIAMPRATLRALFWIYDRILFALAVDALVTVSENVRRRVIGARLVPPGKVTAIANGVDIDRFHGDPVETGRRREEFGVGPGDVLIVTVARLVWFKGLDALIDAAPALFSACANARLVIVGAGPLDERLREQARALGVADRILFAGERADVPAILGAADIFVLPSVSEGMPISILEAMAAGKPVVATAVGGVPELVVDGETGLVTPPRAPAALAAALISLAGNAGLRRAMGASGRARAARDFSISAMVARTGALYASLLAASRKTANGEGASRGRRPNAA